MKDNLRELAKDLAEKEKDYAPFKRRFSEELLTLIDAEGDGGAVAEVIAGYSIKWLGPDYACSLAPGTKLYTHTARSGVVSDEELQAEAEAFAVRAGFTYGWNNLESGARRMAERAALEHFAKGERHER